jgi:predicted NBD/HSP70 family sugar kinase
VIDGEVVGSPIPGWGGIDLAGLLARAFDLPVFLDNDVNTLTVAAQLYGAGTGASTFVVVTVGRGIGMGLVVNGDLYRGRHGAAGELGHVLAVPDGPACWCGRRGCLEAIAAEPALVRDVLAATGRLRAPGDLANLAGREPGVAAILANAGRLVGRAVGDAVMVLDPERVIVSGEGVRLGAVYLDAIAEGVRAHHGMTGLELVVEPWGDEAWARGAATLVLRELFHPAHLREDGPPAAARDDRETGAPGRLARMGRGGSR